MKWSFRAWVFPLSERDRRIGQVLEFLFFGLLIGVSIGYAIMPKEGEIVLRGRFNHYDGSIYWASLGALVFSMTLFSIHTYVLLQKVKVQSGIYQYVMLTVGTFFCLTMAEYYFQFLLEDFYDLSGKDEFEALKERMELLYETDRSSNIDMPIWAGNCIVLLFSYLAFAMRYWIENELLRSRKEEIRLSAELSALRHQVNPHFMFNALNDIYGLAHEYKADKIVRMVDLLSDMLRYMLYKANQETVLLSDELEYIRSFVSMQEWRFFPDQRSDISMDIEQENLEGVQIAPMLLLPVVENAFKFGILDGHGKVVIKSVMDGGELIFNVINSVHSNSMETRIDEFSGIGLSNVQERLRLIYPKKHTLTVEQVDGEYSLHLRIDLT